eukprot:TRINITY_DN7523_c0_g2_i1.p1 TRINITY_DN7523_c0_g2~~TRINITY_DN7523_c0_g2_i1.p1  ORF type:complete len:450 (+),score=106.38 TRINITY_DN7523_c0_g2_i1:59-1351(+)
MADQVEVRLTWNKNNYNVSIDFSQPPEAFRMQLYSLTSVPPEKQKIMLPGGVLKDDWTKFRKRIKPNGKVMMMGTAVEVSAPSEEIQFVEDLPPQQQNFSGLPAGLVNLGNTCYMNSTLQCVRSVQELVFALREGSISNTPEHRIKQLLLEMFHKLDESKTPVVPYVFLATFRSLYPQFAEMNEGRYSQQDAEEFLTCLLNTLDLATSTEVRDNLGGILEDTISCEEAVDEEPIVSTTSFLKVPIHINQDTTNIYSCLDNSLSEILVKNSPSLGREADYVRTSKFKELPYYLTVQFVRFFWKKKDNVRAKITKPIDFPFEIDLYNYCTDDLKESMDKYRIVEDESLPEVVDPNKNVNGIYSLVSFVTHKGRTADGGHYVSYVKGDDDEWLMYDDDVVSVVSEESVRDITKGAGADYYIPYLCIFKSKAPE